MNYKYLSDTVVARIDDDGVSRMSCSIENGDFQAWLARGNTPLPADPIPVVAPIDPVEKLRQFLTANPDVAALL